MSTSLPIFSTSTLAPAEPDPNEASPMVHAPKLLVVGGGHIAYEETGGDGPLVIMVPGLGDLRSEYRFLSADLAAQGHHVVMMDLRGHGDSSTGFRDFSVPTVADDVLALIEHLDHGPAILIGASFGAAVVADAAARAPERVAGLVVIGPAVRDERPGLFMRIAMSLLFDAPWGVAAWAWFYGTLYKTRKPKDHAAHVAALKKNLREPGRFDAVRAMMRADREASEPRLADVRAKALVVMGSKDPDFPVPSEEAQRIAERLRGRALMVEGAGHYPHAEMPEVVSPAIADFVASTRAAQ